MEERIAYLKVVRTKLSDQRKDFEQEVNDLEREFETRSTRYDHLRGQLRLCKSNVRDQLKFLNTFAPRRNPVLNSYSTIHNLASSIKTVQVFEPYFPPTVLYIEPNQESPCPGCKLRLPTFLNSSGTCVKSSQFINHCLLDCDAYLKLDLHANCVECQLTFLTKRTYHHHLSSCHQRQRPPWMSSHLHDSCFKHGESVHVNCKGCQKEFAAVKTSAHVYPSIDYVIHCVEECSDYKDLNLLRECEICELKFLNPRAYSAHKKTHLKSDFFGDKDNRKVCGPRPKWMTKSTFKKSGLTNHFDSTIECAGCSKEFPARKKFVKGVLTETIPRIDFVIHCVEECVEFQQLGKISECTICNCKFLNRECLTSHSKFCKQISESSSNEESQV